MASGKSVCGRALAEKLGREFVDSDTVIEEKCGMSINDIFEKYGEEKFASSIAKKITNSIFLFILSPKII